ncbi:uncharacterized protein E6C27_scaffold149G001630 [Cucumis melo var. makuwa]|nr:uncharacterized protein E6C27_scaffold149G001630 [Cucumis melo var. makuwa]
MQDPTEGQSVKGFSNPRVQKKAKGWWKSILTRRRNVHTLAWKTFKDIFEEKYYLRTYYEAKRDEFLGLKQGCRRFERGLCYEIHTLVTAIAKWLNFFQLVETTLRVEQSIAEGKLAVEPSHEVSISNGFRCRKQRRFTPRVKFQADKT